MNGAESLAQTLANCGIEVCFANPGTSEMHFVAALDSAPTLRPVLCLFEGVATGAADGYGRIAGKPAATLLHLGPGRANGLANLHNARRAATPIVNVVGDHATHHLQYDAPLTSDIVGFARPVSSWICTSTSALNVGADAARAVQAARAAPGGVATLILPADTAWNPADCASGPLPDIALAQAGPAEIDSAGRRLRNGKPTALLLRGPAMQGIGLEAAGRIQAATGVRLLCDTFSPHTELGAGRVAVERLPYFAEHMIEFLKGLEQIILVGAKAPVTFFAYPGKPSWCAPDGCEFSILSQPHEDGVAALLGLAAAVDAPPEPRSRIALELPGMPAGRLTPSAVAQIIARLLPAGVIISDDSVTARYPLLLALGSAQPSTHLPVTGGSIGQGLPVAVGAALAAPDRKVLCTQGDGAAAYTLQALWTMARERLDVTTVIFANRTYAVLNIELQRVGIASAGAKALSMLDLHNPEIDWARVSSGLGVEASRATTCEEFASQFSSAMRGTGPRLIEALV